MSSVINTNMASLVAQRNLNTAQSALTTSVERLSSGLRINRAKDDAAGLGISENLQAQTRSVRQASRNANDAISVVQAAEGGLTEVASMLQRMKELAVQGSNDSLSTQQKGFITKELTSLADEITAVSTRTTFNGSKLLGGATDKLSFQVGADNGDAIKVDITKDYGTGSTGLDLDTLISAATDTTGFNALSLELDDAINTVAAGRADFGAMQGRLDHNIANLSTQSENLDAARSRIQDVDYASETANLTRGQIMQQAATAMLSQANQMPNVILSLMK